MKRFALIAGALLAVVFAAAPASAMPLGLRTTMWGIAAAQRGGGGDPSQGDLPPHGTPIFTIVDGVLTAVDLNGATDVEIPESVTNIAGRVFYQCEELRSVTVPASVRFIGSSAFAYCTSLKEVIFEEGSAELTLVYPFAYTALTELHLPARWNSRSNGNPFEYCGALTNATITPGNSTFAIVNGLLLSADGKTVHGALGGLSSIDIPESVETIAYRSLQGLPNVEEIVFPDTVLMLEEQSICQCSSLKTIRFGKGIVCLESPGVARSLIWGCADLKAVYFSGNAPTNDTQHIYQSTPDDMVTYVTRDSTGWNVDIPGMWNGRQIKYVDEDQPEPEPWDPSTIRIDTEASYDVNEDGSFSLDLGELVLSATKPTVTVKGLPKGLKYDAKKGVISGKVTIPGEYRVTVSATNATVKQPVTAEFYIVVPNLSSAVLQGLKAEKDAYGVVVCGVNLDTDLIDCKPEDGWTVKVTGLPAGLKFTAKDVMKKGSKEIPANTIYGVPTKAGKYTVKFTATRGKEKQTATITLSVSALPDWATGSFTGYVAGMQDARAYHGFASMTIAANGKISGKIALDGTNWAFSASSYAAVESSSNVTTSDFVIKAVAKAGKATRPVELAVRDGGLVETALPNAVAEGTFGDDDLKLYRNIWKDKSTATVAKATIAKFVGVYTVSVADSVATCGSGYLSLTVGKDGNVKATGKLADGTSVSATSPLMYDGDAGWFVLLYAAPSAYKGGAFAAAVGFEAESDVEVSLKPPYRLDAVIFTPQWCSKNPQATGEFGEGFDRSVVLAGAYYDKLEKLNAYFESLRFGFDGAPALDFTFKETSLNEQGRKVTVSHASTTPAVDTLGQSGLTATVNEKGALVVTKATKPVQDSETKAWAYEGANDGALALSFTQATGIFKGSYTFWFDYKSAYDATKDKETWMHSSKKVNFEGIWVQGRNTLGGFCLWDVTGEYEDAKTGKTKTYKYKQSFPVNLSAE